MQTLPIVITLSHLRALHDALRETFPISKSKLLNGTETSFRRAPISNNCHRVVIISTSISTQIPNQKAAKQIKKRSQP